MNDIDDQVRCAGCTAIVAPGTAARDLNGKSWCKTCYDAWFVDDDTGTCDRCGYPVTRDVACLGHDGHVLCDLCAGEWHGQVGHLIHRCAGCHASLTLAEDHRVKDGVAWCEACYSHRHVTCECCSRDVPNEQSVVSEQLFATMCKTCHAAWLRRTDADETRSRARQ